MTTDRYTLRFTNVVCSSDGTTYNNIDDAITSGKRAGFEFTVWKADRMVASWTVFGGIRNTERSY